MTQFRLLGLSGSLRRASNSTVLLDLNAQNRAAATIATALR